MRKFKKKYCKLICEKSCEFLTAKRRNQVGLMGYASIMESVNAHIPCCNRCGLCTLSFFPELVPEVILCFFSPKPHFTAVICRSCRSELLPSPSHGLEPFFHHSLSQVFAATASPTSCSPGPVHQAAPASGKRAATS